VCAGLALLIGCDGGQPQTRSAPAQQQDAVPAAEPRFKASLFVNIHTAGPNTGARGSLGQPWKKTGWIRCGCPDAVSKVTWRFLRHVEGKDVYSFTRRFPVGQPNVSEETKEVEYDGTRLVLFKDAWHRISLLPDSEETPAPAATSKPGSAPAA